MHEGSLLLLSRLRGRERETATIADREASRATEEWTRPPRQLLCLFVESCELDVSTRSELCGDPERSELETAKGSYNITDGPYGRNSTSLSGSE